MIYISDGSQTSHSDNQHCDCVSRHGVITSLTLKSENVQKSLVNQNLQPAFCWCLLLWRWMISSPDVIWVDLFWKKLSSWVRWGKKKWRFSNPYPRLGDWIQISTLFPRILFFSRPCLETAMFAEIFVKFLNESSPVNCCNPQWETAPGHRHQLHLSLPVRLNNGGKRWKKSCGMNLGLHIYFYLFIHVYQNINIYAHICIAQKFTYIYIIYVKMSSSQNLLLSVVQGFTIQWPRRERFHVREKVRPFKGLTRRPLFSDW